MFQKELSSKDGIIADYMHKIKQITQWKPTLHTDPIPADTLQTPNTLIDINSEKKENWSTHTSFGNNCWKQKKFDLDQLHEFKEKRRKFYAFKNWNYNEVQTSKTKESESLVSQCFYSKNSTIIVGDSIINWIPEEKIS